MRAGRDGALGHADRECRLVPTKVAAPEGCSSGWATHVACGQCHTGAVSESGDVYSWGQGQTGCLGHADNKDRLQPTRIECLHEDGVKAVHSASGHSHMVVTDCSGRVFTWGYGVRREDAGGLGLTWSAVRPCRGDASSAMLLNSALFHAKIARICPLPTTLALAFASLTHHRLGKASNAARQPHARRHHIITPSRRYTPASLPLPRFLPPPPRGVSLHRPRIRVPWPVRVVFVVRVRARALVTASTHVRGS